MTAPVPQQSPGAQPVGATSESDAAERIQTMFNRIAPTYDRANHLLSFGLDRRWWRRAARSFQPILERPGAHVVDLCCGTGDMTAALLELRPQLPAAEPVLGIDFSAPMLTRARHKHRDRNARFIEGDAMHLPLAADSLDLVVAAFGFRNLRNYAEALAEIHRVLRPGASFGILEANQPGGFVGALYSIYFTRVLPRLGGMLSGDPSAYRYFPASVARFPRPPRMLELIRAAGFTDAGWTGYTFGTAGLFRARKPA